MNVQLGPWPALTRLTLSNTLGDFRLRHWPPLEAEAIGLSSLAVLQVFVQSDATGLLQLEHTILDLMLKTSASWQMPLELNTFDTSTTSTFRTLVACTKHA